MLASRKYFMTATVIKTNKIPNKCSGLNSSKELLNTSNDILREHETIDYRLLVRPQSFFVMYLPWSVLPDCGGSGGGSVSTVRKCALTICFRFLPGPSRPQYTNWTPAWYQAHNLMQFHYFISFHLCIREKAFKLQEDRNKMLGLIDRMHKWRPKKYSFVYVLIASLASFAWIKYKRKVAWERG